MKLRWTVTACAMPLLLGACQSQKASDEDPARQSAEAAGTSNRAKLGSADDARDEQKPASVDGVPAPEAASPPLGVGRGDLEGGKGVGPGAGLGSGGRNDASRDAQTKALRGPRRIDPAYDKDKKELPASAPTEVDPMQAGSRPASPAPPSVESVLDANGRFATTYRPGGGHLAAFESAVAAGIVPVSEREIVADVGARYPAQLEAPSEGALAFRADFERQKLAPSGGPVHLRLSLKSTDQAASVRPQLSVVVVMDVSGSMRGKLIKAARDAATDLVDKLGDNDDFSLVTFSTEAQVHIPIGKVGTRKEQLKKQISEVAEGGGTNIGEGLRLGYEQSLDKRVKGDPVRVVFLLSDGRANEGLTDARKLSRLSLDAFQAGIQTSSFGLGTDYDGPLMSQIASDGAGGYYYLRDAAQVSPALSTELGKRLDPVATALEVRVRLKPGVDLLNVYGSRRLSETEAARVRTIEVAQDAQTAQRSGIKQNRQDDKEGGMRFFIPAFARSDSHSILLKLRLPEGVGEKDIALVELKYKDLVTKKNVIDESTLKLAYATSDAESAASQDKQVARTVQGFGAGEALRKAAELIGSGQAERAVDLLGEREGLLHHAATMLGEPQFVEDAKRLARLRLHAQGRASLSDPLVVAMMMEAASSSRLH